jgi:hypothetical protein
LILTGPTRGIVFSSDAYFEINLKIKEDRESNDRQFSKVLIDVDIAAINSVINRKSSVSWLSKVDLIFAYVKKALEGTIEIKILSGPDAFCGKISACTTDVPSHILLYDSAVHGTYPLGDDRVIQLLRRVVAVSADQTLIFHMYARSSDQNTTDINHYICNFTPLIKSADRLEITCGVYKLQVEVTWSTFSL